MITLFLVISLAAMLFFVLYGSWFINLVDIASQFHNAKGIQEHITKHPKIGQNVKFAQPIAYIVRKQPAIVPIIATTKYELLWIHPKSNSEVINQYIPNDTNFIITDVYTYENIINQRRYYYALSDQKGMKYVVSESTFEMLIKPIYQDAKAPVKIFDDLYLNKNYVELKFVTIKKNNSRLNGEYFSKCDIQNYSVVKWNQKAISTVDFNQLVCLYEYFWNDFNSEQFPISFEIIK